MNDLKQSGDMIISEVAHGECCDECGHNILMDGTCPNCEEKEWVEEELKKVYA